MKSGGDGTIPQTCQKVVRVVRNFAHNLLRQGLDRFQLVVDAATLRVQNGKFIDVHRLSQGVTSVELIEESREPLPGLDAMYFLRRRGILMEDLGTWEALLYASNITSTRSSQQVHFCFTQPVDQSLLSRLTEARRWLQDALAFRWFSSVSMVPDSHLVSELVQKLVDVCRCLQTTSPSIRCQTDLCHTIGERVLRELNLSVAWKSRVLRSIHRADSFLRHKAPNTPNQPSESICVPFDKELRYMHIEAARSHVEAKARWLHQDPALNNIFSKTRHPDGSPHENMPKQSPPSCDI
eukprot:Skav216125  [mRNA]  locus=scaffold1946:262053:270437:+ [translate_table: standard]